MLALLAIISLEDLPLYCVYKPPNLLIRCFQHRWPEVLWQVATNKPIIALTIDDAPSEHTTEILQVLKENDATGTFFVIGSQVAGRSAILEQVIRDGNELGNHAMRDEPSRNLDEATLLDQIHVVEGMITDAYAAVGEGAKQPRFFRPGSGFFSDKMRTMLARLDYRLVLGSIYPHDPQVSYPSVNARHILSMLRPGGIIICHDRRSWTAPMLRKVLPEARRRGYKIVRLSDLLREAPS